ncbi:hypothetical protein FDF29_12170 [Clostridium botulinum]|uniref:Phage protein n=1 Tax=Clostridium botulinum (strain Hall / ATCC 3502 / NCTC 13319 / Type A) TaxID=441771 RepID=A5I2M7_CLOBH|nr:hypothetical protein [Clostridium botulinum]NFL68433.1 hypothetical protein [Clostridium botulinum]NFQ52612.1 hypothetical protein [Clostridium botulinum]NFT46992.1 hypothetical protein [Clostridium botulinum]QGT42419.1 hypothetical protein GJ703_00596 [Clostridium botulinum]CAL83294.1 putative phage protein [Clostridium botulinum A str. ATCC 3502]
MKKEIRFLIVGLLIGACTRFIGIAKAIEPSEDNCPENGEYMYCLDKTTPLWISIYDVHQEEKFIYLRQPNSNKIIKLVELK